MTKEIQNFYSRFVVTKSPHRLGDGRGYRQSRRNSARQGGFGQFWGADSEYGCYTKVCGGV